MKRLAILSILLACTAFAQDHVINVHGRAVHVVTDGKNGPVVVFESGLGDTLESWSLVQPEVAKFAQTFAYDRAGSGASQNMTSERSYKQLASELHEALENQKLAPPYILVGHSFGAIIVRAFYAAWPKEVSAIVFIDPMTENMLATSADRKAQEERLRSAPAGVREEFAYLEKDRADHFAALNAFATPKVPMTLLVARSVRPPGWEKAVLDRYEPWILERDDSSMTVTPNSAHRIQRDEPQLVIAAIRRLVFPAPLPALRRTLRDKGIDAALAKFREQATTYPRQEMNPNILNDLGYEELEAGHTDNAIRIFALNVEAFAEESNAWDSLGEAYAAKGDRENAIAKYTRALELDPKNVHAAEAIARLRAQR